MAEMTNKQFLGLVLDELGGMRAARLLGAVAIWGVLGGGSLVGELREAGRSRATSYRALADLHRVRERYRVARGLPADAISDAEMVRRIAALSTGEPARRGKGTPNAVKAPPRAS